MNHRVIKMLVLACVPVAGCTPGYYQRSADRQVAEIVEKRKEQTLAYKPESKVSTKAPEPTPERVYEKIPTSAVPNEQFRVLERLAVEWTPEPMGPKVPPPEDQNFDYVPESYAYFGASMDRLGPPAPGDVRVSLDLLQTVEYAVTHARDYQDRMEDLYLATLDVTLQRHLFDPTPFARTELGYEGNNGGLQRVDDPQYRSAFRAVNRVGVRQQLPYGGQIVAEQLVSVVRALNDSTQDGESAETAISASIPLLRDAGLVNLEELINSERQLVYAVRTFETYRRSFAVNVASQFFRLVSQQQAIKNRRQNYENLKLLSERSAAMFAASKVSFLDVQRARQNLLNAENSLVDAINVYQSQLDNFKISIGMPVTADLEIIPIELQVNVPDLDKADASQLALQYRLDLQSARDRVDDARRGIANARNGLLPDMRLNGRYGVGNMEGEEWLQYDDSSTNYSAGVTLDWPLDRVAERNAYRRSMVQFDRAQRSYVNTREQIISDVRNVTRSIRLALITLEIQRRGVELNQRRLDLANERLAQGKAGVLDVVDAQSALLNAQDALDRARANLQTQVLQYLRDTGTLRLDPSAGSLAMAMDRAAVRQNKGSVFQEIDERIKSLENQ